MTPKNIKNIIEKDIGRKVNTRIFNDYMKEGGYEYSGPNPSDVVLTYIDYVRQYWSPWLKIPEEYRDARLVSMLYHIFTGFQLDKEFLNKAMKAVASAIFVAFPAYAKITKLDRDRAILLAEYLGKDMKVDDVVQLAYVILKLGPRRSIQKIAAILRHARLKSPAHSVLLRDMTRRLVEIFSNKYRVSKDYWEAVGSKSPVLGLSILMYNDEQAALRDIETNDMYYDRRLYGDIKWLWVSDVNDIVDTARYETENVIVGGIAYGLSDLCDYKSVSQHFDIVFCICMHPKVAENIAMNEHFAGIDLVASLEVMYIPSQRVIKELEDEGKKIELDGISI
jgi:hypothetical protein